MDPLTISSMVITSFSIILSISAAIYKTVKKHKEGDSRKEYNVKEIDLPYLEGHKEHGHKEHGSNDFNINDLGLCHVADCYNSGSRAKVYLSGDYDNGCS